MIFEPADLRDEQPQRSDQAGHGAAPQLLREPADYKRASLRGPLVPASMTSVHPCGHWPRSGALSGMTGVQVSSERAGASASFRPDLDTGDASSAKAGVQQHRRLGYSQWLRRASGRPCPEEGIFFRAGRSNPRREMEEWRT